MVDRDRKTKRKDILDRLNSYDTGPSHGEHEDQERAKRHHADREKALSKVGVGLVGWAAWGGYVAPAN